MTVVGLAQAYVEVAQRDRELLLKQIQELSTRVEQLDAHLKECKECLAPAAPAPAPVLAPAPDDVTLADE